MKNILILGTARSGKSTLAKMISKELGIGIISIDSLITAFQETHPEMGFKHFGSSCKNLITPFVVSYAKALMYNQPNIPFIIEGYHIELEDAKKLFDKNLFEIIVLGYPLLTPREALENVRRFEGKFDYTRALTDDELQNIVSRHVEYSKKFEKECRDLGLTFYDTSYNRDTTLKNIMEKFKYTAHNI